MKQHEITSIVIGLLLVVGGALFLLMNFGLFENAGALIIALLFAAGGAAFLAVFVTNTNRNWWALIPGFALLGIGGLIASNTLFPGLAGTLSAGMFLGALSLAFWGIYATHPEHWWAIIPGGVLLTLAGVTTVGDTFGGALGGSLFFLGLAVTFGLVYLLPTPQGRMKWAIWPAGACLAMGLIVLLGATGLFNYIWPLALILGGLYLVYRTTQRRSLQ